MPNHILSKEEKAEGPSLEVGFKMGSVEFDATPQRARNINGPKVSLSFFSFPLKRIMSEKMQPTEKQILAANPVVGIPDLIYCPDVLLTPWQEHPRPCPGPQSHLLCAAHRTSHSLSLPQNSCFLLALHAT